MVAYGSGHLHATAAANTDTRLLWIEALREPQHASEPASDCPRKLDAGRHEAGHGAEDAGENGEPHARLSLTRPEGRLKDVLGRLGHLETHEISGELRAAKTADTK